METLLIMMLMPLPILVESVADPSPGLWRSKQEARNLECVRMSHEQAAQLHPGEVPPLPARRTAAIDDALVCTRRILRQGERSARDELILSSLRRMVGEIAQVAGSSVGEGVTWHVDAFYPEPRVARKISIAARTELAESGRKVSDRVPLLAAGDLSVLGRMPPQRAYPLACARYFAEGSLKQGEAFLGLMLLDARESELHAGVCVDGQWRWLR